MIGLVPKIQCRRNMNPELTICFGQVDTYLYINKTFNIRKKMYCQRFSDRTNIKLKVKEKALELEVKIRVRRAQRERL